MLSIRRRRGRSKQMSPSEHDFFSSRIFAAIESEGPVNRVNFQAAGLAVYNGQSPGMENRKAKPKGKVH